MNTYERAISLIMSDPDLCHEISKLVSRNVQAKTVRRPMSMTAAMRDLYQFIRDYTEANNGVAPSYDEMKEFAGLASKSGIHRLITALEERGLIRRLPHRARAIVCVEQELIRGETARKQTRLQRVPNKMADAHGIARDQLRSYIERIERLEEEKKTIGDDIRDVYGEAKAMGFDAKILRKVIALRNKDADERAEEEAVLNTYLVALGMQPDLFDEAA